LSFAFDNSVYGDKTTTKRGYFTPELEEKNILALSQKKRYLSLFSQTQNKQTHKNIDKQIQANYQ